MMEEGIEYYKKDFGITLPYWKRGFSLSGRF